MGRLALADVLPHLCLGGVQLLFGATAVVGRLGIRGSSPVHFTIWRFMLAVPALTLLQLSRVGGLSLPLPEHLPPMLLGAICLVGSNLGITLGIVLSGQVTASSWQPMQLLFSALISFAFGIESPSSTKLAGIASGFLGAATIVLLDPQVRSAATFAGGSVWGHGALLANTLSSGALFVIRKRLVARKENGKGTALAPLYVVTWMHIFAAPALLLLGVVARVADGQDLASAVAFIATPPMEGSTWLALVFYTMVPTMVCQFGTAWAAKTMEPCTMALYSVLQPTASASLSAAVRALFPQLQGTLAAPAANLLGAVPVLLGLRLVASPPAAAAGSCLKQA